MKTTSKINSQTKRMSVPFIEGQITLIQEFMEEFNEETGLNLSVQKFIAFLAMEGIRSLEEKRNKSNEFNIVMSSKKKVPEENLI